MILEKPCKLVISNHAGGYQFIWRDGKQLYAHRVALEEKLGRPIGPGFEACHKCDVRNCVEPEHLYEGTQFQNAMDRGERGIKKTHCKNGHEFTEENTYKYRGQRMCKTCHRVTEYKRRHAISSS